jgi:hypothetical protein
MLKRLCAELRSLREIVLGRVAAVGGHIDENWLPLTEAIVDGKIAEFLFAPEYAGARHSLVEGRAGDSRVMTLLVLECVAEVDAERRGRGTTSEAA